MKIRERLLDLIEPAVISAVLLVIVAVLVFGGPGCATTMSARDQERASCVALCLARAGMDAAACREITGSQAIELQACILRCTCEGEESQ